MAVMFWLSLFLRQFLTSCDCEFRWILHPASELTLKGKVVKDINCTVSFDRRIILNQTATSELVYNH